MGDDSNGVDDFLDEADGGIFADQAGAVEALRESAKAVGMNPDFVAKEDGSQTRYYARKNCKNCFGRGFVNMVVSPSKQKVYWRNENISPVKKKRKNKKKKSRGKNRAGAMKKSQKIITGIAPGNELDEAWNTRKSEPLEYRRENMVKSPCRCVKEREL